jgi:hypothetical protein
MAAMPTMHAKMMERIFCSAEVGVSSGHVSAQRVGDDGSS